MRNLLLFVLAATVAVGCSRESVDELTNSPAVEGRSLVVSLDEEGDETRIQLNEDVKTVWNEGDLVSVFYRSTVNEQWQFQGKTGDRTGNILPLDSSIVPPATGNDIVVVYPYNDGYFYNSDTKNVQASLPTEQTYLKDSYGTNGNIMVSSSEYNNISLKSVCGWLKLQLTGAGEEIESITVRGNSGEQLAGELYINTSDATSTLASQLTESDDDSEVSGTLVRPGTILTEVTLNCLDGSSPTEKGVALGAETTAFYIALPPQTFAKGITVEITAIDGSAMTKSTDNEVVIERNHIKPMASLTFKATKPANNEIWYTATVKVEPNDTGAFGATYISNVWDSETGKGVITFSGDVTKIGDSAFRFCDSLTSVTIPDSVTTIGGLAFNSCKSLTSVTIGDSVTTIGDSAFSVCESLKEFKGKFAADGGRCLIVDGVLNAFAIGCGVTQYTIPDSVTTIGRSAFYFCKSLTSVTIPDSVTTIGVFAFDSCRSFTSVTIPASVTTIGEQAFYNCTSLTSVTIPNSVTTIGDYAFSSCDSLKTVYCKPTTPPTGGYDMFTGNAYGRKIYVPASDNDSIINAYKAKQYWSSYADYIFEEEPKPANNEIWYTATAKVEPNDTGAFGATYLSNEWDSETGKGVITFEGNVTKIGEQAFYNCYSLTSVTIPDSVTTIGNYAFRDCGSLTSVTIGNSVTTIGDGAFHSCYILTSVTIPDSVETIGDAAFWGCTSLTSVTIPDSVTTIGDYAFNICTKLTSVTIPNSVTTIGEATFRNCSSLKEFKGKFAADNGRCLIKDNTIIAYAEASGTTYTIPDSVTTIGNWAFGYCGSLTSVTIPDSVTAIRNCAFYNCSSLATVYCKPTTPPTGGSLMFDDNASGRNIYVPSASVSTYKAAKYWSDYASNIFEEE